LLPQNKKLKALARNLHSSATRHENRLWYEFLRNYPRPFNRQMVIKDYIAGFYCAKARLVAPLDGSQHYTEDGISRDAAREDAMNSLGLEVLRFSTLDIDRNFAGACEAIDLAVQRRAAKPT